MTRHVTQGVTLWHPWPDMCTTDARLDYDATDPYAVTLTFPSPSGRTTGGARWAFARELLVDAAELGRTTGEGDVRVELIDGWLWLTLWPEPGCTLTYLLSQPSAKKFLAATYEAVPLGAETYLVEAELTRFARSLA